jgi:tetrathionate reductase subunit B
LVEKGGTPACVTTCMTGVRMFGDLDDPNSEISKFIAKNKMKQFKAEINTKPRIYYRKA